MKVPFCDLTRQNKEVADELKKAIMDVISSGNYILGKEVELFEKEMAAYIGTEYAVGVASGTDALYLILRALKIGAGDEVITTPFTFIATADSIARCGAKPVFADIDFFTFNLDPDSVSKKITTKTKAILAVHLFGQPANLSALGELAQENGLYLVEDCAQAQGASLNGKMAGSFGIASAFSFFPTKPLGGIGDGGIVLTNDQALALDIQSLRAHGAKRKYFHEQVGLNSRLDEIQAAILRVKLKKLDEWNKERRYIAHIYNQKIKKAALPAAVEGTKHVYHCYTIRTLERDTLKEALEREGIGCSIYYPIPLHLQPCFRSLGYKAGDLPKSEKAANEVLSLPIFAGMKSEEIDAVCEAVNSL